MLLVSSYLLLDVCIYFTIIVLMCLSNAFFLFTNNICKDGNTRLSLQVHLMLMVTLHFITRRLRRKSGRQGLVL